MEGFFTILIFFGVIAVTALVFGVWVIATIAKAVFRGLAALFADQPPQRMPGMGVLCTHEQCHALNPAAAQFCRRCGQQLPAIQRLPIRRVAMW